MNDAERAEHPQNKSTHPTRIVLVDDHPIVRQGLVQILRQQKEFEVCGEAADEAGAWQVISHQVPDLVIVDLTLKSGSGLDLIKQIRSEFPEMAILVLSMHEELFHVERALRAGAWGYLTKGEAGDKILTAIRQVLSGELYLNVPFSSNLLRRLISGNPSETESGISCLSDRELQVFQLIGKGKRVQEIADELHLSVKTIETHQAHIRAKLDLEDSRKLVQYAIQWALQHELK